MRDPEPTLAHQRIVFFDGFNAPNTAWQTQPVVAGGQARLAAIDGLVELVLMRCNANTRIELGGDVVVVGPQPAVFKQLIVGAAPSAQLFYDVEMIDEAAGNGRRRSLMRNDATSGTAVYTEFAWRREPGVGIETGPLTVRFDTGADGYSAVVGHGGVAPVLTTAGLGAIGSDRTTMHVQDLDVVLDYVIQIDRL